MRRTPVVIAVALTTLLGAGTASALAVVDPHRTDPPSAVIDPELQGKLSVAASDEMVDVVVVLKAQADLSAIPPTTRPQRLAAVERALRTIASATQKGLLDLLAARQGQGLVARFVSLWVFNGIEVKATPSVITELAARSEVREIHADLRIQAPLATATTTTTAAPAEANIAKVNAPGMWNLGFRGQGIVVANMDTGVDVTHPELSTRWRGGTNSWYDPNGEHPTTPTDVNGHGTWTMGVMVGGDAASTSIGMAPDADWIAVKIFNDHGTATSSGIHLGFQWLLDPDGNPSTADAPNVVNNSWTSTFGCNLDFQLDLRSLRAAGILPIFAAGNSGPTSGTSMGPANNPEAFAVGATDDSDGIDPSSSRGPSACGGSVYPNLVAPGVGVRTTDLYGSYVSETGTSMAAPHVAGALALLLDAFPNLSADRQAAGLQSAALDLGASGADNVFGYGRLDVMAAYNWLLSSPDFVLSASPSSRDVAPGGSVTYSVTATGVNGFGGDVSLSLAGLSASQATWSFTPLVVTNGSGTSQLSVTTASNLAPGTYPLTISGTSGSLTRSASVTLVVTQSPDFALSASPTSRSTQPGSAVTFTITVAALNGFTSDVALSLTGLPSSVGTSTFAPGVVSGGAGSSQLTVTSSSSAPSGTYLLNVVGSSGTATHNVAVTLVVSAAPDFSISVAPASVSVKRGKAASYTVTISALQGFSGNVALSAGGLPNGATASFSPNPVTSSGVSTLTVRTSGRTSRGTFTLTITGASGTLSHQVTTSLTVG